MKAIVVKDGYRVVQDPEFGFYHLDPIPTQEELGEFYESKYADLIKRGGAAPEMRRFLSSGETRDREIEWINLTLYSDILWALESFGVFTESEWFRSRLPEMYRR